MPLSLNLERLLRLLFCGNSVAFGEHFGSGSITSLPWCPNPVCYHPNSGVIADMV
jgi:hypothetical protein